MNDTILIVLNGDIITILKQCFRGVLYIITKSLAIFTTLKQQSRKKNIRLLLSRQMKRRLRQNAV
jgi:hypothetical protein